DGSSVIFLVRRKRSSAWISTMRLIWQANDELPACRLARVPAERLPEAGRYSTVEFSRLCVVRKFRRSARNGEDSADRWDDSFLNANYRGSESWIFVGLIRAAWAYSRANMISHWIFLIADPLAR